MTTWKTGEDTVEQCSGSWISPNYFLSAKHCKRPQDDHLEIDCFEKKNGKTFFNTYKPTWSEPHPKLDLIMSYVPNTQREDYFSLPDSAHHASLLEKNLCFAAGWGFSNFNKNDFGVLRAGLVDFSWNIAGLLNGLAGGGTIGFQPLLRPGDSGGPLYCWDNISKHRLIGVHHSGTGFRSYSVLLKNAWTWLQKFTVP
jgi:hypothetical protein